MRLSLTDRQLALVRDAAAGVPPDRRSRFLEAVADRLLGCVPTDDDVAEPSRNVNVWYRAKAARRGRTGDENDPQRSCTKFVCCDAACAWRLRGERLIRGLLGPTFL